MRGLSFFILRSPNPYSCSFTGRVVTSTFPMRAQRLLRSMRGTRASRAARSPWASSVPVVGDPAGQAQMQGCGAGIIAEAYALHCAGEAPAAADGAHASMPVTV